MIDKLEFEKGRNILREKLEKESQIIMQTVRSKDKAKEALENIIGLQKQIDVIPTITVLDYGDAIDQLYANGTTVTLGEDFVHLHSSGFETIIKASNNSTINIYKYYKRLFDLHSQGKFTDNERLEYETLMLYCTLTFQFPVMWFGDPEILQKRFIESYDYYVQLLQFTNDLLQKDDLLQNEEFKEQVLFAQSLPKKLD